MAMTPEEEYGAAFNGPAEQPAAAPVEEAPAEDTANMPTDSAAEGTGGEPTEAVSLTPEEGGEAMPAAEGEAAPVEDWEQKYKTLQGKYNAEIAARKESALSDAEAGEPMESEEGEKPGESMAEEAAEQLPVVQEIRKMALDLMQSGNLEAALNDAVDNYGKDFLALSAVLGGLLFDDMAQPYISEMNGSLSSLITDVTDAFASRDMDQIADAHEDIEQIIDSEPFQEWQASLPEDQAAKAEEVLSSGTPTRVVKLLNQFKAYVEQSKQPSAEDMWAEDAAAGVKSSAPLRLPERPAASRDDEYSRAWAAM